MRQRHWIRNALALLATAALPLMQPAPARAAAENWPGDRVVRLVVPASAGGSLDTLARPLAQAMSELSGGKFIVENRGGAAGMIGADQVAKAAPDGYTFLFGAVHHMILPAVYKTPYNTETDLLPIGLFAIVPNVVIVRADAPYNTLQELIEAARQQPGALNYGTGGLGGLHHLSTEMFKQKAGIDMVPVHYKGSAPALSDLLSGQIQLMFETMPAALAQIRAGTLKALAVTSSERSPALPEVPTLQEAGIPDMAVTTWYGFFAPAGLPDAIAEKMRKLMQDALATERIRALWRDYGAVTRGEGSDDFRGFALAELRRWGEVARQVGLKPE